MAKPQVETIRVRYIGSKPYWRDNTALYGSGLDFEHGQVREVPAHLGKSFLRHQDLFERVSNAGRPPKLLEKDDTAELLEQAKQARHVEDEKIHQRLDLFARIDQMDRRALSEFAKINYRVSLQATDSQEAMRDQVRGLIDQFGVVGGL